MCSCKNKVKTTSQTSGDNLVKLTLNTEIINSSSSNMINTMVEQINK